MDYVGLNHEPYEEVYNALAYRRNDDFVFRKCESAAEKKKYSKK